MRSSSSPSLFRCSLASSRRSSARVSVTLANKGEDAFLPHIYGSEITVERVLNKTGSGSYKIKNAEGKVMDGKKSTLDAIRESHIELPAKWRD